MLAETTTCALHVGGSVPVGGDSCLENEELAAEDTLLAQEVARHLSFSRLLHDPAPHDTRSAAATEAPHYSCNILR